VNRSLSAIARYTFREGVRNRLFALTCVGLVCAFGLAEFAAELAVTGGRQNSAALLGAGMRLFTACAVCLFVITSTVREFNDKGVELILSLPIPRHAWLLGKYLGFLALALVIVAATGALLLLYSPPAAIGAWMLSMACELAILVAASLLCLLTFGNVTVAFVLVAAFYFLARCIDAIVLISMSPILQSGSVAQEFMTLLVKTLAFVLPELHRFTSGGWLVYGAGTAELGAVLAQTLIYVPLLLAAALFDLYRKDL
jgi:ABC-type transport system involved in multi-copper enzyme maturation permease subunit